MTGWSHPKVLLLLNAVRYITSSYLTAWQLQQTFKTKQGMQDKKVFEYAVIRVVPRIEREEFINVGVILFCKATRYLACTWSIDEPRLSAFAPDLDIEEVRGHLEAFERIAAGAKL